MYRRMQFVVMFLFVFSAAAWAQQDPFLGTWKQNMAKSVYDPASMTPKSGTTVKREAAPGGGVNITTDGMDAQGKPTHTEYTAKYDGKDNPVKGSPNYDTISLRLTNPNTRIAVYKKAGVVVRMSRTTVSKDGKSNITEDVGAYGTGPAFRSSAFFDKQ
jgi:hypothetical protein